MVIRVPEELEPTCEQNIRNAKRRQLYIGPFDTILENSMRLNVNAEVSN